MKDRILTRHPDPGKAGVNIQRDKYDAVKAAIVDVLAEKGPQTFTQLSAAAGKRLARGFEGSVSWYVVTVKLDLEARGMVRRVPGSRPQLLELTARGR